MKIVLPKFITNKAKDERQIVVPLCQGNSVILVASLPLIYLWLAISQFVKVSLFFM